MITTRQKDWPPSFGLHEIPLPTFTQTESLAFLRRCLDESRASEADLIALHKRFGGLPLPLDLAASYLQHVDKLSAAGYLEQLSLDHPSLKNWRAKYPTATQHDKDVAASFALSWERVEDENARRLFLLAGYGLPNEPLPLDVLQTAANLEDAPFSEAMDLLKGLSLLQPEPSLHPLLAEFARLQDADHAAHLRWARVLARRGYPGFDHGGIYRDPSLARYLRLSLPDILSAASLPEQEPKERSNLCFHTAFLLTHFGDLDGAMKLYQQAREIYEGLGDLKGKAMTLGMMGQALWASGAHGKAIASLFSGLMLLVQLKIEPRTQQAMASVLADWRREIGAEKFDALWQQEIGQPPPDWLAQESEQ